MFVSGHKDMKDNHLKAKMILTWPEREKKKKWLAIILQKTLLHYHMWE